MQLDTYLEDMTQLIDTRQTVADALHLTDTWLTQELRLRILALHENAVYHRCTEGKNG